jgi:hypothetical protein
MNGVGRVRSPPQIESRWEPLMMAPKGIGSDPAALLWRLSASSAA